MFGKNVCGTKFILNKRQSLNSNANADADTNADADAEMPVPRFPNGCFQTVCKVLLKMQDQLFKFFSQTDRN